jgi:hypothetical protein
MTDSNSTFASAAPYGSPAAAAQPVRPQTVTTAFWLYIAAAALSLASLIVTILGFDTLKQEAISQVDSQGQSDVLPEGSVDAILDATFGVSIALAVVGLALYVVFGILVRRGMGWARWVMLAFAAFSLFGIIGQYGIGALQFLCLALGTVLVFLPRSREFFAAAKATRQARQLSV